MHRCLSKCALGVVTSGERNRGHDRRVQQLVRPVVHNCPADPCLNHTQRQAVKQHPSTHPGSSQSVVDARLDGTQSDSGRTLFRALEQGVKGSLFDTWTRRAARCLRGLAFAMDHYWPARVCSCKRCKCASQAKSSARRRRARHRI